MRGNILITVLALLMILSISSVYVAREVFWGNKVIALQRDSLQLDLFVDEALLKAEQLILGLPIDITPVDWPNCLGVPCVLLAQEGNFFLEQRVEQWLGDQAVSMPLSLSSDKVQAWVILEHLNTQLDENGLNRQQYFRTSFLLLSGSAQSQLRMQATWKKTTLNGNMNWAGSLVRLAWR